MSKVLVLAEKPSVAREIAGVLDVKKKKAGYLEGQNFYITWFLGHLLTLSEPQDYDERFKKWNLEDLPIIPSKFKYKVREIKGKRDIKAEAQLNTIKHLLNSNEVTEVYCATDPGAEGEYIFREVYYYLKCRKPVQRLWLKSLTDNGIRSALESMKPMSVYDNLYQSARCRSEADWLIGMNLSRAYSVSLKGNYSLGRVQTPTLALMVNRELEIQEFIPVKYCTLKADYGEFTATYFIPNRQDEYPVEWIVDRKEAERIKGLIEGKCATVEAINKNDIAEKPPLLYDLDSLRVDCSSQFGLTAEETLDIVQFLYERKLVSYPRTDSCYLSTKDAYIFGDILSALYTQYSAYVAEIRNNNYFMRPEFINDEKVTEHSALIPTEKAPYGALNEAHLKVYDLICRRFLSAFMPNYEALQTSILIDYIGCDTRGKFHVSGRLTKVIGWRALYCEENEEAKLDALTVGSQLKTLGIAIDEKKSRPPSRYTDGSLIEAMKTAGKHVEDPEARALMKGIGTPATRSGIIERLIAVNYIQRIGRVLHPTPKAIELIQLIQDEVLKSPELTGEWEKRRNHIEQGKYSPEEFMKGIVSLVNVMVSRIKGYDVPDSIMLTQDTETAPEEQSEEMREPSTNKRCITLNIKVERQISITSPQKEVTLELSRERNSNDAQKGKPKIVISHGKGH